MAKTIVENIARELNISENFVSKAMSNKYSINESVRKQILDFAQQNKQGENLKNNYNVVLVTDRDGFANTVYWAKIIDRIENELFLHNINMILSVVEADESAYQHKLKADADGYIILGLVNEYVLHAVEKLKVPIVLIDYKRTDLNHNHVRVNNHLGMMKMAEIVLKKNHRHILYIGSEPKFAASFDERLRGLKDYIDNSGTNTKLDTLFISNGAEVYTKKKVIYEFLQKNPTITAIVCCNDLFAISVIHVLIGYGIDVPGDISVVGFDNTKESKLLYPELTTVDVPKTELARIGVEMLIKKLECAESVNTLTLIEPKIVFRKSLSERRE